MIPFQLHRRIPLLRRPFYQRDQARTERDAALAARDVLVSEGREVSRAGRMNWVRHRPVEDTRGSAGISGPIQTEIDDRNLVRRVVESYRAASGTAVGEANSFWLTEFARIKRPDHEILISGNDASVTRLLRNPAESRLFIGFDELHDHSGLPEHGISHVISDSGWLYDGLLRIAEAIGARRLTYPERLGPGPRTPEVEELLEDLDRAAGFRITFPNPFPGETGLATSRGVASFRAIQSLYQAWRIAELVDTRLAVHVVEIGAGLGRTAFYARQFGVANYTIVDLPLTNVAQAYFLGRVMGPEAISLFDEPPAPVRILPPAAFFGSTDHYNLAINVDSLTEMGLDTARAYCQALRTRTSTFLSINHEYNPFSVREIYQDLGIRSAARMPYWLRRGYVDEIFRFAT